MGQYIRMSLLFVLLAVVVQRAEGHGKMIVPVGRNALFNTQRSKTSDPSWKMCTGDSSHINYSDKGQNCGGISSQHTQSTNNGRCSACGDEYVRPYPRPHDYRGGFAPYIQPVVGYKEGELINVTILISASHKGYFEFRLCTINEKDSNPNPGDPNDVLTECFTQKTSDFYQLTMGDGAIRYTGPTGSINQNKKYIVPVQLPAGVTCPRGCSFQWWYVAGNNYGDKQEHFVNCADIVIGTCQDYVNGNVNVDNICAHGLSKEAQACVANNGQDSSSSGSSQSSSGTSSNNNVNNNGGVGPLYEEPANTDSSSCNCEQICESQSNTVNERCAAGMWAREAENEEWCEMTCKYLDPHCPQELCCPLSANLLARMTKLKEKLEQKRGGGGYGK